MYHAYVAPKDESEEDFLSEFLADTDKVLKKNPDDVVARLYRGMTLNKLGRHDEGFEYMDKTVDMARGGDKSMAQELSYLSKGIEMNRMREYEKAIAYYKKALKVNPDRGMTHFYMGNVLDNMSRSADSIEYFDNALRLKYNPPDVYYGKAHALNNCKRHNAAIECAKELLRIYPDYANGHYEMALSYISLKDYENGIKCYKKTIEADPRHKKGHEYLGIAYMAIGLDHLARPYLEKALEIAPGDPDVLEMMDLLSD